MAKRRVVIRAIRLAVALTSLLLLGPAQGWAAPPVGHWISIGPSRVTAPPTQGYGSYNAVGRLTTIAVDPSNPKIIYAGSAGQLGHEGSGVWKTTDGGTTWVPISDDLPTLSIGAIAIDPSNHDRVYIVTADEGLFRSDDAGSHWNHLYGDLHIRTNTGDGDWAVLLINPVAPNVLYVTSDLGVQRSVDGGQHWSVSLSAVHATSLVMDPLNPDRLYAAILGQGIYKTENGSASGGATWTLQTQSPLPSGSIYGTSILLAISHPAAAPSETVYALFPRLQAGDLVWDLYRTDDGLNWSKRYSSNPAVFAIMAADPVDPQRVYLGGPLFWVSSDGGHHFAQVPATENDRQPASPHGDYWELVIDPTNPGILYAGSDGGIYKSSDHGLSGTWTFIGEGITNVEMYDLALADTPVVRAISGTQDNGNIRYDGSLVWDHIPHDQVNLSIQGGDGAGVAIDPTDADRFYAVFDNRGTPKVSPDGGVNFQDFNNGIPSATSGACGIWNMTFHIQIHPTNSQVLLESCFSLWRTATAAPPGSWIEILSPPTGQQVIRSAVESTLDVYYAGTNKGHLFAGASGAGWQEVFAHPESLYVSDLEVDQLHPDTLYASFAPVTTIDRNCAALAGTHRIYQLKRVSPSLPSVAMTAADITGSLPPGLCVNALAIDPVVAGTLYAGTNKGVYRGRINVSNGPWVWEPYNDGMPPADVRDLEVHPVTGHIFAATFGRSAFEVAPETNAPPVLTLPGPQSVDFNDPLTFGVSATDADAADTLSFSASGLPAGLTLTDNGNRTATVSGTVSASPGVYTATITVNDGHNPPVPGNVQITVTKEETAIAQSGTFTQDYHDPYLASATLTDPDGGAPIAGKLITFTLGVGDTCTASTNTLGVASCSITPTQAAGTVTLVASFGPDTNYLSTSNSHSFVITKEETTTQYTGPLVIANGLPVTLSGKLLEDGVTPISGRTLTLSVGSQSCTGTTDAGANASCTIPTVSVPLGPATVKADFAGDAFYLPSSESKTAIVFAFPARGDFVLGDSTVAAAGPTTALTYWGAQWSILNALSVGAPEPSFKGFAATPSSTPPACGGTWTTAPGDSSLPVATVPSYMGVAVASTVAKSKSMISGNIVHIVVIKTDPGYAPNPGHAGTGTLVATYCY